MGKSTLALRVHLLSGTSLVLSCKPLFHFSPFQFTNFYTIIGFILCTYKSNKTKVDQTLSCKSNLAMFRLLAFYCDVELQLTRKDTFESETVWAYTSLFSAAEAGKSPLLSVHLGCFIVI